MAKRWFIICARLGFGLLTLIALGIQFKITAQLPNFNPVNFFSYFTNLSNIFASFVFIISALYLIKRRKPSATDDIIRGTAVLYMSITGVVFSALLRNIELGVLLPWINTVVHYIMPIVVVLDWLYQPPSTQLVARQILFWLIFPLLYIVYSLIRGSIVNWYPYPFLNPAKVGGYAGVALYCLGMLVTFFFLSWLLMKLGNSLKRNIP